MSLREHAWEFAVNALSWVVIIAALVVVSAFIAFDMIRLHAKRGRR